MAHQNHPRCPSCRLLRQLGKRSERSRSQRHRSRARQRVLLPRQKLCGPRFQSWTFVERKHPRTHRQPLLWHRQTLFPARSPPWTGQPTPRITRQLGRSLRHLRKLSSSLLRRHHSLVNNFTRHLGWHSLLMKPWLRPSPSRPLTMLCRRPSRKVRGSRENKG